jgi:GNAT superfamily N-acetyltransferase
VDSPHLYPLSAEHVRLSLRFGHQNRPPTHLFTAMTESGTVIGLGELDFPVWDNPRLGGIGLQVHPDHRRSGAADTLLARMLEITLAAGRPLVIGGAWAGSDWEGFWQHHGFTPAVTAAQRRLVVADLDWAVLDRLYDESLAASGDYDTVVLDMPAPDDMVPGLLDLHRAMNDSPLDDLDVEDEVWDEERLRCYERAMTNRGIALHRLLARRRSDGVLGGHTIVAVEKERPWLGFQEDTAVIAGHRGHRLGMRLKIEMLRRLRDLEPQIGTLDTWNVESNAHMIAVNDALGCVVVGRSVDFQKELST